MESITYVGLVAGTLTTISFLPQAIKTWKTKSTKDISLAMFLCFCLGVILWLFYGFYTDNLPVFGFLDSSLQIEIWLESLTFKPGKSRVCSYLRSDSGAN